MSAGAFSRSRYELRNGSICNIRVQPETLALSVGGGTNDPPAGAVDFGVTARTSQSKRAYGIKPRTVTLAWSGAAPTGYSGDPISNIPILDPTLFDTLVVGTAGTYLGAGVTVVGKSPESVR